MNLFDYLKAVTDPKQDLDFSDPIVSQGYDQYMMNRWISMCDIFLPVCAEINMYEVPKEVHYRYYKSLLPQRNVFYDYIKKEKDFTWEEKKIIAHHFCANIRKVDEMISMMDEKEVKDILNIYRNEDGSFSYSK